MLLRLLLALLIALPMPAMAACHPAPEAAPVATAGHEHHMPAAPEPVKQTPAEQLCIGCVAPATIRAPKLAAPIEHGLVLAAPIALTGEPLSAPAPDTPPPRSEA